MTVTEPMNLLTQLTKIRILSNKMCKWKSLNFSGPLRYVWVCLFRRIKLSAKNWQIDKSSHSFHFILYLSNSKWLMQSSSSFYTSHCSVLISRKVIKPKLYSIGKAKTLRRMEERFFRWIVWYENIRHCTSYLLNKIMLFS